MLKIDNTLLQEIGLDGLPEAEKNSFLKHIYETLEMRVGIRLADQMTNQQLDEFERYFEAKDDAGAFKWLETNFPNYKDIVQEEFDKLKAEVAGQAPQILAASQQQPQQPVPQPMPEQPQQYTQPYNQPQTPADAQYGGAQPQAAPAPAQPYAAPPQPQQYAQPPQSYPNPAADPTNNPYQQPQYPPQQPPAGPPQQ